MEITSGSSHTISVKNKGYTARVRFEDGKFKYLSIGDSATSTLIFGANAVSDTINLLQTLHEQLKKEGLVK